METRQVIFVLTVSAALLVAGVASWLRVSPWWIFLLASTASAVAVALFAQLEECHATSASHWFDVAILVGIGLSIAGAFAALVDAFRLARARAPGAAFARLVPLLLSAALGFGTFVLLIAAIALPRLSAVRQPAARSAGDAVAHPPPRKVAGDDFCRLLLPVSIDVGAHAVVPLELGRGRARRVRPAAAR